MSKSQSRRRQDSDESQYDRVVAEFVACPRCSFFLTGYRVEQGVETIRTAAETSQDGWLSLPWSHEVRDLLGRSYGVRVDLGHYYYEGTCPDCQRRFRYEEMEGGDIAFAIELRGG